MSVLYSSDTPGGKLVGVLVPLDRDPGENTEPCAVEVVGVAVPELGRELLNVEILVVDSNSLERLGFDRRYGSDAREDAGDARCLGSVADASTFCGKFGGLGVASCGGVMRG